MRYKLLFVGLGSIGKRRLSNISTVLESRNIEFQADALRTKSVGHEGIIDVYLDKDRLPNDYDIIFITNPTSLHYEAMEWLKEKTRHFFVEKPIFDTLCEFDFNKGICYTACPLRFHPVVRSLKKFAQHNDIFAFRAICSSYLPSWKASIDYRSSYSAKKAMGGGVELDLIHEIDYLKWIFGKPAKVLLESVKASNLDIDSNDIALYIIKFPNVLGSLHLDYFGRYKQGKVREIEVFTDSDTVKFDIANNRIDCLKEELVEILGNEDMYLNEMNYFLDILTLNKDEYYSNVEEALCSLKIALGKF
ncbi:MAG: Gfo/Idh/MocA family oxidoreductase [Holosporales bacterium]|nr:Gfo/Idh/MocA family oxidoreductase [Holosporales bacterium]